MASERLYGSDVPPKNFCEAAAAVNGKVMPTQLEVLQPSVRALGGEQVAGA